MNESLLTLIEQKEEELFSTTVTKKTFSDHMGNIHNAIVFGKEDKTMAVKVHNVGKDIDLILDNEKFTAFENSISYLKENGGLLLLIEQPAIHNEQMKEYGIGALMLQALGVEKIRLISQHAHKAFVGIQGFGLEVIDGIEL